MTNIRPLKELIAVTLVTLCAALGPWSDISAAAQNGQYRTIGGLTVYLGVVPAEIVRGPSPHSAERPMHGRILRGPHEYHVIVAIFDAATGARISDATVIAQVSGLGLAGTKQKLDPMEIAKTVTYGAFFHLPGRDLYTVKLAVERSGGNRPVTVNFKYDHRRK